MTQTIEGVATILIVDDTPANLGLVEECLQSLGYRVRVAQDGEEGLQRAALVRPDLILLDVMMPGMDGFEVCRHLKDNAITADIPVIFMTSLVDIEHKVSGFKAGGVDYVTKPIQVEELVARVGTHLRLQSMQRQLAEQNLQLQRHQVELEQRVVQRTAELSASNCLLREEIEERKQVQERLALVDFALNQVSEAAYLIDESGRFHYVNDEACRVLGYPRETLLEMAITDIDLGRPRAHWHESWQQLQRLGNLTFESHHQCHDGRIFPVEINANYLTYQGISYSLSLVRDISERQRMEQALIRREREFRTLAENAPDNIVRFDCDTRVLYMNPMLERALGLTTAQAIGKRTDQLFPDNPAMLSYQRVLEQVIASGQPAEFELVTEPVGGERSLYDLFRIAPELDSDGRVVGAVAVGRDYTEQKRLEQELMRREREYRTLAENSPDVIVRYDRDYRRIYFNHAYLGAVGQVAQDALGKTPQECWWLTSPSAEEYTERLQRAMDSGESDELLVELSDKDGKPAYRNMFLVPEFDENNRPVSVLSISHDITGIKRMEAMLRKSEMEFRTLAENSPEMIVRYDLDCRRTYINPAYERETGIRLEHAWNKTPAEVWRPTMSGSEYMDRLRRVMSSGEPDRILFEWLEADGRLISHDMHAVAEYDEDGQVIGALVIGHNITELKNTERRLQESRAQLRQLTAKREEAREEERKRIAREIHDELGQLLNVLRLNVTTLDYRFGDANPDLRDKARKMVSTVDRAILMVRNLATRLRPAVLSAGIASALEWLVQEYAESTGIHCELFVSDDEIPLSEDRAMVVFRIVQESLTNVLRHAEATRVEIALRNVDGICEVDVRDNGKGFDPQNPGRRNSYGIVGMRERAIILKGELDIVSDEKGGTLLKLRIPIEEQNEEEHTG